MLKPLESLPSQNLFDFIVIGSGFGGSVSALRLVEKGYSVLLLEKGKEWQTQDFPESNWNLKKWFWMPALGLRGFFKMTFMRHLTALSGVGVGGGSLVYANTLPIPDPSFFKSASWSHLADWETELAPYYVAAKKMLGATAYPSRSDADDVLAELAKRSGLSEHHHSTDVAVYFGEPDKEVSDPYFDGEGPDRTGCNFCGGCMVGCRYGAKNTLDKNYLYLARQKGLVLYSDMEADWVRPTEEGYEISATASSKEKYGFSRHHFRAKKIIFAGGVLGTLPLLLRLKESAQGLPKLSERLGDFVRTNSEVLLGVTTSRRDIDLSEGIAITSIIQTDEHSHLEPVRYPAGSGLFRLFMMPHAPGKTFAERSLNALLSVLRRPLRALKAYSVPDWAKYTTILLYMRTLDGHLRTQLGRSIFTGFLRRLQSVPGQGELPSAAIPEASALGEEVADILNGFPASLPTETLFGIPTTAHILGGCVMGESSETGVIDTAHKLFGYEGLYVVDGSAMSANPGVNPSLTITAMAERAMSQIPVKK